MNRPEAKPFSSVRKWFSRHSSSKLLTFCLAELMRSSRTLAPRSNRKDLISDVSTERLESCCELVRLSSCLALCSSGRSSMKPRKSTLYSSSYKSL